MAFCFLDNLLVFFFGEFFLLLGFLLMGLGQDRLGKSLINLI